MVTVKQAKQALERFSIEVTYEKVLLSEAVGRILASDIEAKIDMPPFDQSAVDGYAIINVHESVVQNTQVKILDEIRAGDTPVRKSKVNGAYRIYTGAPVPVCTCCVIMQEKVSVSEDTLTIPIDAMIPESNIRRRGNQYRKGEKLLGRGERLNPAAIGLIASQGIEKVNVIRKPKVGLLITGSELTSPGSPLKPGKIFESNSYALTAYLRMNDILPEVVLHSSDDRKVMKNAVDVLLRRCDIVVITGGISVGKYDLVHDTLSNAGVKELFYKVKQKPGKPLFAGYKGSKMVFGLPGNPAAVLVCFQQYVLPVLRKFDGKQWEQKVIQLPLASDYRLKGDRDLFLRAKIIEGKVRLLTGQDSDNLLSFAHADALAYLPADKSEFVAGEPIEVYPI